MMSRSMTPERWRKVDGILQGALIVERDRRDDYVRGACGADDSLRNEVASLLSVYDAIPADFLERPAVETVGARGVVPPRVRAVATRRIVVYAATAALAFGIVAGWVLRRTFDRWTSVRAAAAAPVSNAPGEPNGGLSLVVVDRTGRLVRAVPANRPWTPRFSPDGRLIAYGAFGDARGSSDVWVTDVDAGTTRRVTDDGLDSNDPQWSPDGGAIAYSVSAPGGKDVAVLPLGGGKATVIARPGNQFPSDWVRGALIVTDDGAGKRHDVLIQPADGSAARPYAATAADELDGRVSPDQRWIAYASDESGRSEVYVDSYPRPGRRVMISHDGGSAPVWRGNGRELYYWRNNVLVAVQLDPSSDGGPPLAKTEAELFRAAYPGGLNTMYDVSPDGRRFAIVEGR